MYISKIKIINYKCFSETEVEFKEGLNVILGHNNGGKSTLLEAISLVIDTEKSKRLTAWDFHQGMGLDSLKQNPPGIFISLYLSMSDNEDYNSGDVALFSSYNIVLEPKVEACLTYEFYLPTTEHELYRELVADASNTLDIIKIIDSRFIRKYTYSIYGGKPSLHQSVSSEDLRKIDFQKVDALRNVNRDLFSKRADLLHDVLSYFLDYDIKNCAESKEDKDSKLNELRSNFKSEIGKSISSLINRIKGGKDEILKYADKTGALYQNSDLIFDGTITEEELIKVLNIAVSSCIGYHIPISNNGLGYNNLIYISLLLAKMQSNKEVSYMGTTNAKAFSILCIEEPEAHLHPELQYHFLKFLRQNILDGKVKQVFVTSHSPSLTAKVRLEELCCLFKDNNSITRVYYPGKIYGDDEKSKKFVQRYLDATRADLFFAGKVLFVEGLAEQILIPVFVKKLGYEEEWLRQQAIIVNLSGRYFDHFLKMYNGNKGTFPVRVACITDRDPMTKKRTTERFVSCWPVECYDEDEGKFQNHGQKYVNQYKNHANIHFFSQDEYGKTFEYDIARHNANEPAIITDSMNNQNELKEMLSKNTFEEACKVCNSQELIDIFKKNTRWDDGHKRAGLIAARYLCSLSKGEYALELATVLSESTETSKRFNVPPYIKNAIEWLLEKK